MNVMSTQQAAPARFMPADIAEGIQNIGKVFDESVVGTTRDLYLGALEALSHDGITIHRDLAYGPNERHRLDVHVAADGEGKDLASVIFFHGGGFVAGHKNAGGDIFYGNVADFFVRNGIIGINATYRLAPEAQFPEGSRDVGAAVAWAREHIAEYGGDPDKIFVMGQSAGASHVANYVFRARHHPEDGPGCAGVILFSGVYDPAPKNAPPNLQAYYGTDDSRYAESAVLGNIDRFDFPVLISTAEYDPLMFQGSAVRLAAELVTKHRHMPQIKMLMGHNHISQVMGIGTGDAMLEADLVDFVRTVAKG